VRLIGASAAGEQAHKAEAIGGLEFTMEVMMAP